MGILDLIRKKKDDDLGLGMNTAPMDMNAGMPEFSDNHPTTPDVTSVNLSTMGAASMNNSQPYSGYSQSQPMEKDFQIISLKLDAIKAELDSINQRVRNIEMIAEKEQQQPVQKRWY